MMQIEVYNFQQKYPGKWETFTVESIEELIDIIDCNLSDSEWIYDCDIAGYRDFFYLFRYRNARAYIRFTHEWYAIDEEPDGFEVINNFYHEFVRPNFKDFKFPSKNRDWIKV
jgi:hypothetical protein